MGVGQEEGPLWLRLTPATAELPHGSPSPLRVSTGPRCLHLAQNVEALLHFSRSTASPLALATTRRSCG